MMSLFLLSMRREFGGFSNLISNSMIEERPAPVMIVIEKRRGRKRGGKVLTASLRLRSSDLLQKKYIY